MTEDIKKKFLLELEPHKNLLYRICKMYSNSNDDFNDLKQEILFNLWKSYPSFNRNSSFSTWMYRIAFNIAIMSLRKKERNTSASFDENMYSGEEKNTVYPEEINLLYNCMDGLSKIDKAIIILNLGQYSYREISEITGLSEKNISVKLVRIKEQLKQCLIKRGYRHER